MQVNTRPKWDIAATEQASTRAYELVTKYRSDIEPRLQPNTIDQLQEDMKELINRHSGQTESLTKQKSSTQDKNQSIRDLHNTIISIHDMVKAGNPDKDILQAFGVGTDIYIRSKSDNIAGANLIVDAYNNNKDWANSVGIIDNDIEELSTLLTDVDESQTSQGKAIFTRTAQTLDKNNLQRKVEDTVTQLSAIGAHVFRKDPGTAQLFKNLIPGNGNNGSSAPQTDTTVSTASN